jgi:hypothetical protein
MKHSAIQLQRSGGRAILRLPNVGIGLRPLPSIKT